MRVRSNQLEILDLGPEYYTRQEYRDCLHKLRIVNKLLNGRFTIQVFKKLRPAPVSILDVGCGGGYFTQRLGSLFPSARVVGIDIDPEAISYAKSELKHLNLKQKESITNVTFEIPPSPKLSAPERSFDVVTATLVCHHFSDEEIIDFLRRSGRIAKQAIIINDLHRSPIAYALFWLISFLFMNRIIRNDGLLSIKRSFRKKDWHRLLEAAGFSRAQYSIKWNWPFRWVVVVRL